MAISKGSGLVHAVPPRIKELPGLRAIYRASGLRDFMLRRQEVKAQKAALSWAAETAALLSEKAAPLPDGPSPHVVCVGAQKAGTTFLYNTVSLHPLVGTRRKDTGSILPVQSERSVHAAFDAEFIDKPDGVKAIRALNPDARILICLRHPVDRAFSEYRMRLRQRHEDRTFQEALAANEPDGPRAYMRRSLYAADVARYRDTFHNVLILFLEDDPRANLFRLFQFMGLRDDDVLRLAGSPHPHHHHSTTAVVQLRKAALPRQTWALHETPPRDRSELFDRHFRTDTEQLAAALARPLPYHDN